MWLFKKKQPVPEFVPYIKIYQNGHGNYTLRHYPDPEFGFIIKNAGPFGNLVQAESFAEKFLDHIRKSEDIKFVSRIPK